MGLKSLEAETIKKEFLDEYLKPELKAYMPSCGISNLRVMKEWRNKTFNLNSGEQLEDLCLHITFGEKPGNDKFSFPSEYKGLRVFYSVIGKIRPH